MYIELVSHFGFWLKVRDEEEVTQNDPSTVQGALFFISTKV